MSLRICAWMVTSSAVIVSSAMRISGGQSRGTAPVNAAAHRRARLEAHRNPFAEPAQTRNLKAR